MDAQLFARIAATGRVAIGGALLAAPERFARPWLGEDAGRAGTKVATRALGARDLALGAGALASSGGDLRRWVAASVIADLTDFLATVAAGDALPRGGRILVGALASGSAAFGAVTVTRLE